MANPKFIALTKSGVYPEPGSNVGTEIFGPVVSTTGNLPAFADDQGAELVDSGISSTELVDNINALLAALTDAERGAAVGASTIALGTNSATAAALPAATGGIYPVTAADDAVGVRIDVADKVLNRRLLIGNLVFNKILKIYPPTGGTINGASADAAFPTLSGQSATLVCTNATTNAWLAFC